MSYPEALRRYWAARDRNAVLDEGFFSALEREMQTELRRSVVPRSLGFGSAIFPFSAAQLPQERAYPHYFPDSRRVTGTTPNPTYFNSTADERFQTGIDPVFSRLFTGLHETFHHFTSRQLHRYAQTAVSGPFVDHPDSQNLIATFGRVSSMLAEKFNASNLQGYSGFGMFLMENHADLATHIWLRSNMQRNGLTDSFIDQNLQRLGHLRSYNSLMPSGHSHNTSTMTLYPTIMGQNGKIPFGLSLEKASTIATQIMRDNIDVLALQFLAASTKTTGQEINATPLSGIDRAILTTRAFLQSRNNELQYFFGGRTDTPTTQLDILPWAEGVIRSGRGLYREMGIPHTALITADHNGRVQLFISGDNADLTITRDPEGRFSGRFESFEGNQKRVRVIDPVRAGEMFSAIPSKIKDFAIHPAQRGITTQVNHVTAPLVPEADVRRTPSSTPTAPAPAPPH